MFPSKSSSIKELDFIEVVQSKAKLYLKEVMEGKDFSEKIDRLEKKQLDFAKPPKLGMQKDSIEIESDKKFEKLCHSLSEHTNRDVKGMTVKEFYSLIEYTEEKIERIKSLKK